MELEYTTPVEPAEALVMLREAGVPGDISFRSSTDLDSMQRIARIRLDGYKACAAMEKLHDAVTVMLASRLADWDRDLA